MIGRRGLLGLILGGPAIAGKIMQETSVGGIGMEQQPFDPVQGPTESSPLERAYRKARNKAERRHGMRMQSPHHMPPHIAGKKSWSAVFKQKVWAEEREAFEADWSWEIDDPETMLRALKKLGQKI